MAKEMVAMILAGGQGSRLYALTDKLAKPAVPFGGKYRIIDFPLSNCVNSGIDTVGILTQYQPLVLNEYIGHGQPWDLDRLHGGVHERFFLTGEKRQKNKTKENRFFHDNRVLCYLFAAKNMQPLQLFSNLLMLGLMSNKKKPF